MEDLWSTRTSLAPRTRTAALAVLLSLVCLALLMAVGCSGGDAGSSTTEDSDAVSTDASQSVLPHGGAAVDVRVSSEALENKPAPWVLSTPEAAVRSYLDWTSYAYRIAQSDVATPTMTTFEEVRIDSYIQYNIQKSRLLDQTLKSITFGTPSVGTTSTLVPAKEAWSYRYVSIENAGETIDGPHSASYDATYTVVKSDTGDWQVDSSVTTLLGEAQ